MKIRLFGLALMVSVAAFLGACNDTATPDADTTTPGEPADTGKTPDAAKPEATKSP